MYISCSYIYPCWFTTPSTPFYLPFFSEKGKFKHFLQGKDDFLRQFETYNHVRPSLCCLVKLTDAGAAANTQVVH